jgi:phage terminase Nu1 subunit (DNA packaging protein)
MGVDRRTVTRWCGQGVPRNDDGTFDAPAVVKWRIAKAEARGQDDQRQRLAAAQAARVERLNQVEMGELLRVEDCVTIWSTLLSDARAALLGLGHKIAPLVANRPAPACCRIIDDEIRVILTDLAERRSKDGLSNL